MRGFGILPPKQKMRHRIKYAPIHATKARRKPNKTRRKPISTSKCRRWNQFLKFPNTLQFNRTARGVNGNFFYLIGYDLDELRYAQMIHFLSSKHLYNNACKRRTQALL
jgi:hypothetical protein